MAEQGIYPALKARKLNTHNTIQGTTKNSYKEQAPISKHTPPTHPITQQTTSNSIQNTQTQLIPHQAPDISEQATLSVNPSPVDNSLDEKLKKALLANRSGFFRLYKMKHLVKDTENLTLN
ncbi:unnamed protein product, partial [Meganyctiphanes norvegica]